MPVPTRTILIVDDDKSILRVFSKVFERRGYAVTAVSTGKDATGEIERNCFDAKLIDIHLPDMKGTSLVPKIQARSANTVKVFFTGSPDMDCLCKEEKNIIAAFLIKPISPEIVIDILRKKIGQKTPCVEF